MKGSLGSHVLFISKMVVFDALDMVWIRLGRLNYWLLDADRCDPSSHSSFFSKMLDVLLMFEETVGEEFLLQLSLRLFCGISACTISELTPNSVLFIDSLNRGNYLNLFC